MRDTRRQRYVDRLDVMEVLYRVYVVGFFGAIGIALLAGAVEEAPATPAAVEWLRRHGPALLGLGIAVGALAGLRVGARGGPLAIEAAEVNYVLLAPIDRGAALRPAAIRQMGISALVGAALGAVIGSFTFRRLPGSAFEWVGSLALFGALVPVAVLGCALLASGRRLRPAAATAVGLLLVAWASADLALGRVTSPATTLGALGTLPVLDGGQAVLAGVGFALTVAVVIFALSGVGGVLLEAAKRRASLVSELRFSAAVQDLRTVVLLRRQLASERPRRQPWLTTPAGMGRYPVWRRGCQSILRWPPARISRVALLGATSGAIAAGAWSGAPLAFVFPGLILFVVALDLVEPLSQESDHPTARRLLPMPSRSLICRHLVAPAVAMAGVILVGALGAVAVGSPVMTALGIAAVLSVPLAFVLVCCAAMSATADPYAHMLFPEAGYVAAAAPLAGSSVAVGVPLLTAHEVERQGGAAEAGALSAVFMLILAGIALVFSLSWRFSKRDAVAA